MTQWCPECNLVLAPKDPFAKTHHGIKFHGDCLPKFKLRLEAQFRNAQTHRRPPKEARHGSFRSDPL